MTPSRFHGSSYFAPATNAPRSPVLQHGPCSRRTPFDHADASSPTAGAKGFADALAKQLSRGATASPTFATSPFALSITTPITLTPRKRSPPSNGESPPPSKTSWHGASSITPFVSRLSLKSDSATSSDNTDLKRVALHQSKALKLPPLAGSRVANKPTNSVQSDRFHALAPPELFRLLQQENAATAILILDLRPHSIFALSDHGRLANSINLCVPSTLLRRPNYKIPKVAESILDADSRDRVLHATSDNDRGILKHIIVIDQSSPVLLADSPVHSLLQKYENDGYRGQLHWAQGGFAALVDTPGFEAFREMGPIAPRDSASGPPSRESSSSSADTNRSISVFSLSSRASGASAATSMTDLSDVMDRKAAASNPQPIIAQSLPQAAFDGRSTQNYISGVRCQSLSNVSELGDTSEPTTTHPEQVTTRRVFANPFFDSIRQNHEALSRETSLSNLQPIAYPFEDALDRIADQLPGYLRSFARLTPKDRARRAAEEYHQLEAMEQTRMQKLMAWHSTEQGASTDSYNPYSISAGVEKGHLNRYRHIFPFEHSRCKLAKYAPGESDYVNASFINFTGDSTTKRYIASQGPVIPACGDFYQLLLQERVGVVVMLCNLQEGGRDKCCKYYTPGTYGHMQVERADAISPLEESQPCPNGGFFTSHDLSRQNEAARKQSKDNPFYQRTLLLTDVSQPARKPHKTLHLQYGDWPDFDIPPNADDLLKLLETVNAANERLAEENGVSELPPVLVHCSAGCGRTGCYIAIDVLVEQLRASKQSSSSASAMDVDQRTPAAVEQNVQDLLDSIANRSTPPLQRADPLFSMVNEMREQRMSMVTNLPQYQFCYEALLLSKLHDLERAGGQQ